MKRNYSAAPLLSSKKSAAENAKLLFWRQESSGKKSAVLGAKQASPNWDQAISGWKKGGFFFESGSSFFGKGRGLF